MPHARLTGIVAHLLLAASLSAGLICVAEAAGQSPAGKPAAIDTLITELVKAKEQPKADTATYDQAIAILVASDELPAAMQLEIVDGIVQTVQADRSFSSCSVYAVSTEITMKSAMGTSPVQGCHQSRLMIEPSSSIGFCW